MGVPVYVDVNVVQVHLSSAVYDHLVQAVVLWENVSLPPDSSCATPTPLHYLSLGTPRNVTEQLES